MIVEEARRRVLERRPGGGARDRRIVRARRRRTASPCGWRARWIARCATSWPSATRARRCSSPIASTRCTRRSTPTASAAQFHPSYTRMVPAHYVVELALVGCPDPDPIYTRFFTPRARHAARRISTRSAARYIGALADEIAKWLHDDRSRRAGAAEPIGVRVLGRHRQRLRVPRDLSHDAAPRACRRRGSRRSC